MKFYATFNSQQNSLNGWIYSEDIEKTKIDVLIDEVLIACITPFLVRKDVNKLLNKNESYNLRTGFEYVIPFMFWDNIEHKIDLRFTENGISLKGFPVQRVIRGDDNKPTNKKYFIVNHENRLPIYKEIANELLKFDFEILLYSIDNLQNIATRIKNAKTVIFQDENLLPIEGFCNSFVSRVSLINKKLKKTSIGTNKKSNIDFIYIDVDDVSSTLLSISDVLKENGLSYFPNLTYDKVIDKLRDSSEGRGHRRFYKNYFLDTKKNKVNRVVPNFLIIGAQKSGTTSLHNYLDQHPDIFMSKPIKEPGFFRDGDFDYLKIKGSRIKNRYSLLSEFMMKDYQGESFFGESSTFYTLRDINSDYNVSKNILKLSPKCKFIYLIRNPFERLVSNYLHELHRSYTEFTLNEWVEHENTSINIRTSLYYTQLKYFLDYFSIDDIYILTYDQLINQSDSTMAGLEKFLGLEKFNNYLFKIYNKTEKKKNISKEKILFSRKNWNVLYDKFTVDLDLLQKYTSFNFKEWDLSEESWSLSKQFLKANK